MALQFEGPSGNIAEVNAIKQLQVVTETDITNNPQYVGGTRIVSENDPGNITGVPRLRSPETSQDYRLRVGVDSIWDNEIFNYAAQNTSKHKYTPTTLAYAYGGGYLTTNSGSITTINTGAVFSTYRVFPIIGTASTYIDIDMTFPSAIATNTTLDFGLFTPNTGVTTPLDGVYFRRTSAGLFGVTNNAGVETVATGLIPFTAVLNKSYQFTIGISRGSVDFWIDDVLFVSINTPVGQGIPCSSMAQPLSIIHRIGAVAAGSVFQSKISNYTVTIGDLDNNRLWASVMSGQGLSGIQGASGHVQGQTSNNVNITAPVSATLANATAGYATLGGQFQFAAVAGAETDYALFAYLNPAHSTTVTGRNLVIRGIWIETFNTVAAVATTPTLLQWTLGVGSTAITLLTTEGAATRATRRLSLGTQALPIGTVAGGQADRRIDVNLDAPVVVEPGTYLHIILKMPVATATATQVIRGIVGINSYWE